MGPAHLTAIILLAACWTAYGSVLVVWNLRMQRERRASAVVEKPLARARSSEFGLLLELAGIVVAWVFPRSMAGGSVWALGTISVALALASTLFVREAARHLGRHLRMRAVVTDQHELITTGPYAVVRHPIYTSLLGMLLATVLLVSEWQAGLAGVALFLTGTEIRVRAEDGLLERRFPMEFRAYRARVRAYIPFLR